MDYKNTLNLPRTAFPMKADLVEREPERLKKWQASGLYQRIQAARQDAPKFVLHDGPPFANGEVHIGTAANKILKDFVIKAHTIRGWRAPFVPGWDCHGLPIEAKVTQELRKAGAEATEPVALRTACEAYARRYIDIQRAQFQRLGVLGDWEHPYLTLDKAYEAEELRLFADLVEKGFVYRGKKPVYWSIPYRTALAEAEVEYQEHVSPSIYVKLPLVGHPGTALVIWTTTPWTLPANLAVAYNSTFSYSLVTVDGQNYIVSTLLLHAVAARCGWSHYQIVRSLHAEHLQELRYQHPFCNRIGRLFAGDEFVDAQTGTGFVHIAPGHGLEDYILGLRYGLPVYSPVDDEGRFTYTDELPPQQQMPAWMIGKSILAPHGKSEANEAVLHELRVRQALLHQENYRHSYPHCWRSKTPVIFRALDQWFIRIDTVPEPAGGSAAAGPAKTFRQAALEAIQQVRWVPAWGKSRIEAAVKARPDWCISRQRTWGVPIPAFYDADGRPILDARIVRKVAELVSQHGSNVWFSWPLDKLWTAVRPADWTGPEPVAKSHETLDVWIDSGSSSRCVIARRPELQGHPHPFQCDLYLEGSDQHRGWFQSSLLLALASQGAPPYKAVLTHGFLVDADREKISKSRQGQAGYEKPQTAEAYIGEYGADVLRLWVASQDFRNDIVVSRQRIQTVAETYRLIRNALRFQLANLSDFDPARHTVPEGELTGLDRWILAEFGRLETEVLAAYEAYEFHVVYQKLARFIAVELSAIYHDVIKDRLYTDPPNSVRRRSTQTALYEVVRRLCQMLSPILAFTADEAWELIPGHGAGDSVHVTVWQPRPLVLSQLEQRVWGHLFQIRERVLPELEKERQAKRIGKALEARVVLSGSHPMVADAQSHWEALRELLNVSQLQVQPQPEGAELLVQVFKAQGQKCQRCWHWAEEVGAHPAHPTLCGRCVEAVSLWQGQSCGAG